MNTEPTLTLAQWFSPAYPVGAFAYSHGLETAIEAGTVHNADTLRDWITPVLTHGSGRNDALFLAAAYRGDPASTDALSRAFAASAERLIETTQQGAAFATTTRTIWGLDLPDYTYPVAVGRAAHLLDLPLELTAQYFLQAFASTLTSVGIRLIPLGQTQGHALIHALSPLCARIAADTAHGDLDQLSATAFSADIHAMQHETLYSRTFRT
jgi:urease accessory protein